MQVSRKKKTIILHDNSGSEFYFIKGIDVIVLCQTSLNYDVMYEQKSPIELQLPQ